MKLKLRSGVVVSESNQRISDHHEICLYLRIRYLFFFLFLFLLFFFFLFLLFYLFLFISSSFSFSSSSSSSFSHRAGGFYRRASNAPSRGPPKLHTDTGARSRHPSLSTSNRTGVSPSYKLISPLLVLP